MSDYELDMFNIQMAGADAEAEEEYWINQEEEDEKRYKEYEQAVLRKNAKKTCTFCNEYGHIVYQMGILTCPLLKQTPCNACGLLGHTPKFCIFLKNTDNNESNNSEIRGFMQLYLNENRRTNNGTLNATSWANKVCQNLTEKAKTQMVDDYIQSCKQNINKYNKI